MFTRWLARGWLLPSLLASGWFLSLRAAEKTETWIEVRSPHFTVISNGGEKQARRLVDQFEQIRGAFQQAFPALRVDPGVPILILGAKNENSLKVLLPEYWETKGRTHPAGIFVNGQEKNYVALRLDASGENPYHIVYHEYVHLLLALNYRYLPVWLDEGLAEFYGNTMIAEKEAGLGRPDESHLLLLQQTKLLPLDVLLAVNHLSPYYNEEKKSSVFYAQSWALVHYLILNERGRNADLLQKYFAALRTRGDSVEAAGLAFGDLKKLQQQIEAYARNSTFYYFRMKRPVELADRDYQARVLSPAESLAARGDFHLHRGRMVEARALLEEALQLDPTLAAGQESLGFLHFRAGNQEEATRRFAEAAKLNSQSYLAHYFHALLSVSSAGRADSLPQAEASLRRAIELNPNFAPAFATLASLYAMQPETLEKALEPARKAAALEPREPDYAFHLVRVLLQMGQASEARGILEQLVREARSEPARRTAENLLSQVCAHEQYQAERRREDTLRAEEEQKARAERERVQKHLSEEAPARPASEPHPAARAAYSATGKITAVVCSEPAAMDLTLDLGAMTLRLRAANYFKVDYLTTRWKPPANFNPCVHLKGLTANISYRLLQGGEYDGEILTIEVKRSAVGPY